MARGSYVNNKGSKHIKISGLDNYVSQLNKLEVDVPKVVESALKATYGFVHKEVNLALKEGVAVKSGGISNPIYLSKTNELRESFISKANVIWNGKTASIDVGFNQKESMHATYLMITGNPYIEPNQRLYNAIYGNRGKLNKIQKEIFEKAIQEAMNK